MNIVYQGEPGCFSEIASKKFFGENIERKGVRSFRDIVDSVLSKENTLGILPVENTLIGKISSNFDLLMKYPVFVVGEIRIKVHFNFMILPESSPDKIVEVWSHPAALEQCKNFIFDKGLKAVSIYDTAGGAKLLKKDKKNNVAILADKNVAKEYGLKMIYENIEDNNNNFTRFLVISNKRKRIIKKGKLKTLLVFGVKNAPGILFKCLSVFALRNINLCSIESRPIPGKPWEYIFFIDFEGDIKDEKHKNAIEGLKDTAEFVKVLGTYTSMEG